MQIRQVKGQSGGTAVVVDHDFTAIERLQRQLQPGDIGLVWGRPVADEFASYLRRRKVSRFARVVVDGNPYAADDVVIRNSSLYARDRYRIYGFLQKDLPVWGPTITVGGEVFAGPLEFASQASWDQLRTFLVTDYVDTRRIKLGADREMEAFLAALQRSPPSGNFVINSRFSVRYEDLITVWFATHQEPLGSLILCVSSNEIPWTKTDLIKTRVQGEYLRLDDVVRSIQVFFGFSEQTVQSALRIWRKSLDAMDEKLVGGGRITRELASKFADAISDTELEPASEADTIIPTQNIAPLRFSVTDGILDILMSREHAAGDAKVRGGAKTCRSAAEDLHDYSGFGNVIPNFDRKVQRILSVLDEIAEQTYDDALVVQLGTEVSALEARVFAAKEQLVESAFHEASAFFAVVYGYLAQFQVWSDYKVSVARSQFAKEDAAFSTSREVLCNVANDSSAASPATQERIDSFIDGLEGDAAALMQREGTVLSAENVASQAAAHLVKQLRHLGLSISNDSRDSLRNKGEDGLGVWFLENVDKMRALANSKDLEWLRSFLDRLES